MTLLGGEGSSLVSDCAAGPMPPRRCCREELRGRRRRCRRRRGRCSGPERGCGTVAGLWPPCCSAAPPEWARPSLHRWSPEQMENHLVRCSSSSPYVGTPRSDGRTMWQWHPPPPQWQPPVQCYQTQLTSSSACLVEQVLAKQFCGTADAMTRIDCSELMQRHSSSKLIGAPPGEPPCRRPVIAAGRLN